MTTMTQQNLSHFPILLDKTSDILTCRAKGVPQQVKKKEISLEYFKDVVMRDRHTKKKVTIHSMRRRDFKISIIKTSKQLLSNFTSKRLFNSHFRKNYTFFSFPLHFKELNLIN